MVRKPEARVVGWSLDLQELVHLRSIVRLAKPRRVLEIGTYDGFTALNLAANLGSKGKLHMLDFHQSQSQDVLRARGIANACVSDIIGSQFRKEPEVKKITQLWGDSTREDWVKFGAPFDLFLINGSHDYGQCVDVSRAVDELALNYPIKAMPGPAPASPVCCPIPSRIFNVHYEST